MLKDTCQQTLANSSRWMHYILSGSFKSTALYLLAFDPVARKLSFRQAIDALGPHQYLATNAAKDRVYATSWAQPPALSSWTVEYSSLEAEPHIRLLNTAPITATSSYITVVDGLASSAGGPTSEVHALDPKTGGFGRKIQQQLYVKDEELEGEDKTNVALRYGSHGIEYNAKGQAFVPHLGRNSIFVYQRTSTGALDLLDEVISPREHDGPRHAVLSKDDAFLYSVTEHTQFVDVYRVEQKTLTYLSSSSLLAPDADPHLYRGDTLRVSFSGQYLFATTRGAKSSTKGILAVYDISSSKSPLSEAICTWETPTSGGKANAIEVSPFLGTGDGTIEQGEEEWIVLTDDDEGWVFVLEWDAKNKQISVVDRVMTPGKSSSHAIWLQ